MARAAWEDGAVKVVYTLRHRMHHPQRELEASGFQEPFENPERADDRHEHASLSPAPTSTIRVEPL